MSHRGDLTDRMVHIPLLLWERPRSHQELVATFKVDSKTIRRDLTILSKHYPITSERNGREVFYSFMEGARYRPPTFTPAELATLLLAQESIAATGLTGIGTPFAGYGRALLAKVRSALPASIRDKLDALAAVLGSATTPAKDFTPYAAVIDKLTSAAVERRRVRLRYYSMNQDRVGVRTVEPYAIYFDPDGATLKVIGFDSERQAVIPFSVDHIKGLEETNEQFERPAGWNLREFLSENCFNGIHNEPILVRLRVYGKTARVFAERRFHDSYRIIEQTPRRGNREETITVEMRVARGRGLERFILSWAPFIEVLEPDSVRQAVSAAHRLALQRHGAEKFSERVE